MAARGNKFRRALCARSRNKRVDIARTEAPRKRAAPWTKSAAKIYVFIFADVCTTACGLFFLEKKREERENEDKVLCKYGRVLRKIFMGWFLF